MKKLQVFLFCTLLVALSAAALAQDKTLYERLGGKEGIVKVVDDFAARCVADARINKKFAKSDAARLKTMLVDQICGATGGPCEYKGNDMKTAHKNMGVTDGEFTALVENLVASLDHLKVPEAEKKELLALLGPMKPKIVEVNSNETGTELPKKFKPAKSLKAGKKDKAKESKADKADAKADSKMDAKADGKADAAADEKMEAKTEEKSGEKAKDKGKKSDKKADKKADKKEKKN